VIADGAATGGRRAIIHAASLADIGEADGTSDRTAPTLSLGGVSAHVTAKAAHLDGSAGLRGEVDLEALRAFVALDVARGAADMHGGLTLAAALLIGRLGRALVHAAALVDPSGGGWLLVGDSHSGKTTTCATLLTAGWRYVADDQIVLAPCVEGLVAEGWPREAHLDPGWRDGQLTSTRVGVDLGLVRPEAWAPQVVVKGVLFPSIAADRPTHLVPVAPADALGRVIRQSPWLLADRSVAPNALALLTTAAAGPCFALSLGRDSYANGERLARCLMPLTGAA
jgi:hypothetical protein